jgi:hypothetical protein
MARDAERKVATSLSEPMKAQLVKIAERHKMSLAEYVRKVLFDHVQTQLDGVSKVRPVKTGSIEHFDEATN